MSDQSEILPSETSRYTLHGANVSPQTQVAGGIDGVDSSWTPFQKIVFRWAFIFFSLVVVPLSWDWWSRLFSIKSFYEFLSIWTAYRFDVVRIPTESGRWGLASYANWGAAFLIAIAGAALWSFFARKSRRKEYNTLYYWLRVLVRYRIAIGIIAFGYIKLFPMQMSYPSISNLNTDFGDYTAYKLYWQSVGVVTWYEIFLGAVEIVAGALLFFRGTAALGAVINAGVLYNIAHANHAYDGGVHVYSAQFVLLSLFVLAYEIPGIWKLLVREQDVQLSDHRPVFSKKGVRYALAGIKSLVIFSFLFLYGYYRYDLHYVKGRLKEPVTPGLTNAQGYYKVTTFRLNNQELPYSPLDSVRWQDAIFEKYSTLTFKVAAPVAITLANGTPQTNDVDRSYELAGVGGGRRYFYYDADTASHLLHLQDKNNGSAEESDGRSKPDKKKAPRTKLDFYYSRPTDSRIILSGLNEKKDSLYIVLDRVDKKYALQIDRSQANW